MDTALLYLIRHGRTTLNSNNQFRGNKDVPLESNGIEDAKEAVKVLKDRGVQPVFMVSSDKTRAMQTAKIFSDAFNIEAIPTSDLRAWNIGVFSGKERSPENTALVEYYANNPDVPIPEGESLNEFRDRISPILDECFDQATASGVGFIICHSSIVHELGNLLMGSHTSLLVEPGGIVSVGFDGDGNVVANKIFKPATPANHAETIS